MQIRRNLITDSPLVEETVEMLRVCGGRAPAADVVDVILKLPDLDAELAALMVADLIRDDHRLSIGGNATVELVCQDAEALPLSEADFVVVDIETTGAKMPPSRIMEIGAYRVSRGHIVAEFQTLVNPEMRIPPFITRLTGISYEMVQSAPKFTKVVDTWLDFVGDAVLVAHDAQFDVRFLNYEIARVFPGQRMANTHLCTVKLSRRMFPGLMNYRLHTSQNILRFRYATVTARRMMLWRRLKSSCACSSACTSTGCETSPKRDASACRRLTTVERFPAAQWLTSSFCGLASALLRHSLRPMKTATISAASTRPIAG